GLPLKVDVRESGNSSLRSSTTPDDEPPCGARANTSPAHQGETMFVKLLKYGTLTLAGSALAGAVVFGSDAASFLRTSAHQVRASVRDNIPVEFQLRRARDLVDQILPEMQANVRLIAE